MTAATDLWIMAALYGCLTLVAVAGWYARWRWPDE